MAITAGYYQPGGAIFLCIDGEDNPWLPSLPAQHLMLGCSLHGVEDPKKVVPQNVEKKLVELSGITEFIWGYGMLW